MVYLKLKCQGFLTTLLIFSYNRPGLYGNCLKRTSVEFALIKAAFSLSVSSAGKGQFLTGIF